MSTIINNEIVVRLHIKKTDSVIDITIISLEKHWSNISSGLHFSNTSNKSRTTDHIFCTEVYAEMFYILKKNLIKIALAYIFNVGQSYVCMQTSKMNIQDVSSFSS